MEATVTLTERMIVLVMWLSMALGILRK